MPLKHIVFEYRDEYCLDGKFNKQECIMESIEDCIAIYGLRFCEYRILSVTEI